MYTVHLISRILHFASKIDHTFFLIKILGQTSFYSYFSFKENGIEADLKHKPKWLHITPIHDIPSALKDSVKKSIKWRQFYMLRRNTPFENTGKGWPPIRPVKKKREKYYYHPG